MIGIFDSGFGGLSVFKEIYKILPQYQYIYLGDSARTPYGSRSQDVVYKYTEQAVDFLFQQGCRLIIIACGTASAEALRKIQQEYLPQHYPKRRVLGVIRPLAEEAVKVSRFGRVSVVGTRSTVDSKAYETELEKVVATQKLTAPSKWKLKVFQQACPLLVSLIEEGWIKKPETKMILKKYLRSLKQKQVDILILGCTHYPLLMKDFKRIMGKNCQVLDSGKIVAESLKVYLSRHPEIESGIKRGSTPLRGVKPLASEELSVSFYTTDNPQRFDKLGSKFFGQVVKSEKIELV